MGIGVWGLGCGNWGVGIGVWELGCGKRAHADHRTGLRSMAVAKGGGGARVAVFSGFPADFTNGFRSELLELGRVDSTLIPADVI